MKTENVEFLPSEWQIGDIFYGPWHAFTLLSIGKKSWGKIPMGGKWVEGHAKADPLCVGVEHLSSHGPSGFGISVDPSRGPEQYSFFRVFREGVEIWRDQARIDRSRGSYQIQEVA